MTDEYFTIAQAATCEVKVKGSRFIGAALPVSTVAHATDAVEQIRKREHAASHHCFAYRVGLDEQSLFKYADDGEPSGTAGRPIYEVICGENLTDTLVVVTRYFGGTKLGTGGLARAYRNTAVAVLKLAGTKKEFVEQVMSIVLPISFYDQLVRLMHSHDVRLVESKFGDEVRLTLAVRVSQIDKLKSHLVDMTHGRIQFE
jgi:uncharacterized YigZ family protein